MRNIVFFVLLLLSSAALATISITNYRVSQESFRPGGQGYITLTITNPSIGAGEDMTGVVASITAPPEFIISSSMYVGDIEPSGSTVLTIPFRIKNYSANGIYSITVRVSGYTKLKTTESQAYYARTVSVPVEVVNYPLFSVSAEPKVLTGLDEVRFVILNNGGPARDVIAAVRGSDAIALYGASQVYVGDILHSAEFTTILDSRNAAGGPTDIPITLTYYDELGNQRSEIVTLRATVKKEVLDIRFVQEGRVVTRKEGEFRLIIRNNGKEQLNDVKLEFLNSSFKLRDKNEMNFGDIPAEGDASAYAVVFADLPPGLNSVAAKLSWTERDVVKEEYTSIPITISSDADVGVYMETKPAPLTVGQEHTLSVLVSNLGSYSIDNVDVELYSDALRNLDVTNRQYIGSLAKDDFSTVQFKVSIPSEVAPGEHTATVKVRYRDQSGEWVTKTTVQPILIYPPQTGNGSTLFIYIVLIALLVIAIWFVFLRKKPRTKV
ncbi:MAG: CARDB domain-containing protein [Candidatus Bilamarchaeaceae archaeon]